MKDSVTLNAGEIGKTCHITADVVKRWMPRLGSRPKAAVRLYCFSHAGGGASTYYQWNKLSSENVEVCPIQLPGREERLSEEAFDNFDSLINSLLPIVFQSIDRPYAIYGHSLGACVGYEIGKRLAATYSKPPLSFFAGAHRSPCLPYHFQSVRDSDDQELTSLVLRFNGLPSAFLHDKEMMAFILPLLRNDFLVCESYVYKERPEFTCPMVIFSGRFDKTTAPEKFPPWTLHSINTTEFVVVDSDHFFLKTHANEVLQKILLSIESEL